MDMPLYAHVTPLAAWTLFAPSAHWDTPVFSKTTVFPGWYRMLQVPPILGKPPQDRPAVCGIRDVTSGIRLTIDPVLGFITACAPQRVRGVPAAVL